MFHSRFLLRQCFLLYRHTAFHKTTTCVFLQNTPDCVLFHFYFGVIYDVFSDSWLMVEACVLTSLLVINVYFVTWDDQLRRVELGDKARRVLTRFDSKCCSCLACSLTSLHLRWRHSAALSLLGTLE